MLKQKQKQEDFITDKPVRVFGFPLHNGHFHYDHFYREHALSADKTYSGVKEAGLTLISHKLIDDILTQKDGQIALNFHCPVRAGTLVAYTEPDRRFGETIEYPDEGSGGITWIFRVPAGGGLRNLKNALLAVEHPHYELEIEQAKKRIIAHPTARRIIPVENFPTTDHWFAKDPKTAIPIYRPLDDRDKRARKLLRNEKGGVGFPTREVLIGHEGWTFYGEDHVDLTCHIYTPCIALTLEGMSDRIKQATGQAGE